MVGLVFAPHPCALNKKCLSFYDVQIILLPFFEIFAPFGSTKKHSSLPLQIDLSTPCTILWGLLILMPNKNCVQKSLCHNLASLRDHIFKYIMTPNGQNMH